MAKETINLEMHSNKVWASNKKIFLILKVDLRGKNQIQISIILMVQW